MTKILKKLKPILKNAIHSRKLETIESALQQCVGIPFPLFEWTTAQTLKVIIIEENRINQLLDTLITKDPESVYEQLCQICAAAQIISFESTQVITGTKLRDEVVDRKKTRAWLSEGVNEADEQKLDWALKRAAELKLDAAPAIQAANQMKIRIAKEKELINKLHSSMSTGGYLNDGDTINFTSLDSIVHEAHTFTMKTVDGMKLEQQAILLNQLRQSLKAALNTKGQKYPLIYCCEQCLLLFILIFLCICL
jgi:hypothetical protein